MDSSCPTLLLSMRNHCNCNHAAQVEYWQTFERQLAGLKLDVHEVMRTPH